MSRPLRPASWSQVASVATALSLLRQARELLAVSDSPAALKRVQGAIKSTEGALRHAQRRAISTDSRG